MIKLKLIPVIAFSLAVFQICGQHISMLYYSGHRLQYEQEQEQEKVTMSGMTMSEEMQHNILQQQDNNNKTTYLILHVGPKKTSTSTIQCALRKIEELQPSLLQQSKIAILETESCRKSPILAKRIQEENLTIGYHGEATYDNVRAGRAFLPNCLNAWKMGMGKMPPCFESSYLRHINEYKMEGISTIISNEIIPSSFARHQRYRDEFLKDLRKSLGDDIKIYVIAYYRHLSEWAYSNRFQEYHVLKSTRPKLKNWPPQNGMRGHVPSFESYVRDSIFNKLNSGAGLEIYDDTIKFFKGYDDSNIHLRVINLHSSSSSSNGGLTNTMHKFFCLGFPPDLNKALCSVAANETLGETRNQSGEDHFWADKLAVAAYRSGLLPKSADRQRSIRQILRHYDRIKRKDSIPLIQSYVCPPKQFYDDLWRFSMLYEQMASSYIDQSQEEAHKMNTEHKSAFDQSIEEQKYCEINTTATLADDRWVQFFSTL